MKNTDLIAHVGGIEKAQKIVDRAPDGADSYVFWTGKTRYINSDLGEIYSVELKEWAPANIMVLNLLNSLSGLRTAITEHDCAVGEREFKVGDLVVFPRNTGHPRIDDNNDLFRVIILNDNKTFASLSDGDGDVWSAETKLLGHATPAEIKAGHRLNPSNSMELETLEMIDVSPNTVVINEN